MGVYQTATIQITVPAEHIAPLAAAIRSEIERQDGGWWYKQTVGWSDHDVAAWYLYATEGGETDPDKEYFKDDVYTVQEDGSLEILAWTDGKLSYDSETVEGLYAEHMADGVIDALCEGEHFRVRLGGGRISRHGGEIVYPTDEDRSDLRNALAAVEQASEGDSNDEEVDALRAALDRALALIPGWTNDEQP